ncbi:hypothetical protein JCM3774_000264 [Rhodotorula dairenensis]
MDRSYGSSTSVLDSPTARHAGLSASILTKAQLAQSVGPATGPTTVRPLSFKPQDLPASGTAGGIVKSVRFSPAQQQHHLSSPYSSGSAPGSGLNSFSAAPSGRVQSLATPPRSYGSPSLLRTAAANSASRSAGSSTPPPRQGQQPQQSQPQQSVSSTSTAAGSAGAAVAAHHSSNPVVNQLRSHLPHLATPQRVQTALAKSGATAVHAAQEGLQHAGLEAKKKLEVVPLGRGEAARRLRVNAVLLVAWWVSSRTTVYRFAAGHLVAAVPQVDTPLHVGETVLLLVLCWNIIDALRLLNRLSSLPPASTAAPLLTRAPSPNTATVARSPSSSTRPSLNSPARSSPKTRPTASLFSGSPSSSSASPGRSANSPFRASALRGTDHPPTPQTPTSALRGSPSLSVTRSASATMATVPSSSSSGSPALGTSDEIKGALLAFEARHGNQYGSGSPIKSSELVGGQSPASVRVKVESREDVERLLDY